jgi:hypothetical protein
MSERMFIYRYRNFLTVDTYSEEKMVAHLEKMTGENLGLKLENYQVFELVPVQITTKAVIALERI